MYVDPLGLKDLTGDKSLSKEQKLRQVSEQFESLFLSQLMHEMRGSADTSDLLGEDSMASKTFRDMWDSAVTQSSAERSSLGIADMVYKQLASVYLTGPDDKTAGNGAAAEQVSGAHKFDLLLKNLRELKGAPKMLDELTAQGLSDKI